MWIVVDFETASACDLKKAGAWRYAEDPSTRVLCLAWEKHDNEKIEKGVWYPGLPYPFEGVQNATFIAHNTAFEKAIWRRIMGFQFGWPDVPDSSWHCTMAACAMRALPQDLDGASKVLELHTQKDMDGRKLTLSFSKVDKDGLLPEPTPEDLRRVGQYCTQDTTGEAELHQRLGPLPPGERMAWLLDQRINQRGIGVDLDFVRAARRVADDAMRPLQAEFAEITGGLKVSQRDKFLFWLELNGLALPNLQKETLAGIMESIDDAELDDLPGPTPGARSDLSYPVRRALTLRDRANASSLKKLEALLACTCSDGRVRGSINYHAAAPGRWGGRLFQPQNFPRGVKHDVDQVVEAIKTGDSEYVRKVIGEPVELVVSSLRHALVAGYGRVFLSGDYAGIQARTVLALAGQHDKTALMASGADIYVDMAEQIYKRKIDKKKDPEERQTGKNSVLGLGFQMGDKKFQWKYARKHPLEFCTHVVHTYRKMWAPRVPKMWWGLQDAALRTVQTGSPHESHGIVYRMEDGWLTATVPTGGKIWYYAPRKVSVRKPWEVEEWQDPYQDVVMAMTQENGRWVSHQLFGGKLTQNVVTRIEVDMIIRAGVLCEKNGFPIVMTVHDELIAEPDKQNADEKAFQQIMLDVHHAVHDMHIPVAVETWAGDRYRK